MKMHILKIILNTENEDIIEKSFYNKKGAENAITNYINNGNQLKAYNIYTREATIEEIEIWRNHKKLLKEAKI